MHNQNNNELKGPYSGQPYSPNATTKQITLGSTKTISIKQLNN